MACSIIGSRIDYCNSLLIGISEQNLDRLQHVQSRAPLIVCNADRRDRHTPSSALLHHLHWLPVCRRIEFKTATPCFTSVKLGTPSYITNMLKPQEPTRTLRSSKLNLLSVPSTYTTLGLRHFSMSGPRLWNELPHDISHCQCKSKMLNLISRHFTSTITRTNIAGCLIAPLTVSDKNMSKLNKYWWYGMVYSPNSTWLVMSCLNTTRHKKTLRQAWWAMLFNQLDTAKMYGLVMSNVSRRDEPSGIWAYVTTTTHLLHSAIDLLACQARFSALSLPLILRQHSYRNNNKYHLQTAIVLYCHIQIFVCFNSTPLTFTMRVLKLKYEARIWQKPVIIHNQTSH